MASQSPPASPEQIHGAAPKPFLKRLFGHQESGLVLVIILMGLALTVYGQIRSIEKNVPVAVAADSTVLLLDRDGGEHEPGTLGNSRVAGYLVKNADGTTDRYTSEEVSRYDADARTINRKVTANAFLNRANLVLVAKDASFFAIIAVGMTGVIILAGIDLSVGSIYGLSAIVGAMALTSLPSDMGWLLAVPIGLAVCVAVGALCGFANGAMTVGLGVHPFVITLGMMAALRSLTIVLPTTFFGAQSIGEFPAAFTTGFFKAEFFGVYPVPVVIMIIVAIAGWYTLSRTVFGRRVFAIGGNEVAAKYAGIPVGRVKILVYTITGALAGLSACVYLGYLGAAETNAGNAYELQVIAATVIGGASLMGGRGTALGAVLGAIVIQLINNAMIILGVDPNYNLFVMGVAIIVAVVIDQSKQKLAARRG